MADELYDSDTLIWSEQQASLLRRLADGERVNDAIDWPHVIEEIEDVGLSQLSACESLLRQALVHLMKLRGGADRPAAHWRVETLGFLTDAQRRFSPSMRQRIDLGRIYRRTLRDLREAHEDAAWTRELPEACPFTLDDLLSEDRHMEALLAKLR